MDEKVLAVEIAKLELKTGDILVVRYPAEWGIRRATGSVSMVKKVVPDGIPVLFFHGDVELSVIRKECDGIRTEQVHGHQ